MILAKVVKCVKNFKKILKKNEEITCECILTVEHEYGTFMKEKFDYLKLFRKAQHGDSKSVELLSRAARGRVYVYIFRLTLNEHLAEDVSQETLLKLILPISPILLIAGAIIIAAVRTIVMAATLTFLIL